MIIKIEITVLIPAIRLASSGRARIIWVMAAIRPERPDASNSVRDRTDNDLLYVSEGCVIDGRERVVGSEVHGHLVVGTASQGGDACRGRIFSFGVTTPLALEHIKSSRHDGRYWWGIARIVFWDVVRKYFVLFGYLLMAKLKFC